MKELKREKGITLVALIITIVVLLILAIVSIGAIRESKIIAHAQKAGNDYTIAQEKEQIGVALGEWQIEGKISNSKFKSVMIGALSNVAKVTGESEDGPVTVRFNKTRNAYIVDKEGNITLKNNEDEDKEQNGDDKTKLKSFKIEVTGGTTLTITPVELVFELSQEEASTIVAKYWYGRTDGFEEDKEWNLKELIRVAVNREFKQNFNTYEELVEGMKTAYPVVLEGPEKVFEYIMEYEDLTYKTVEEFASNVYEYEPISKTLKIRKIGEEWEDITQKATWNKNIAQYQLEANGDYEIQLEMDGKISPLTLAIGPKAYLLKAGTEEAVILYAEEELYTMGNKGKPSETWGRLIETTKEEAINKYGLKLNGFSDSELNELIFCIPVDDDGLWVFSKDRNTMYWPYPDEATNSLVISKEFYYGTHSDELLSKYYHDITDYEYFYTYVAPYSDGGVTVESAYEQIAKIDYANNKVTMWFGDLNGRTTKIGEYIIKSKESNPTEFGITVDGRGRRITTDATRITVEDDSGRTDYMYIQDGVFYGSVKEGTTLNSRYIFTLTRILNSTILAE